MALLIPRDFLVGSALGFDPLPYPHYEAFIDDDEEALWDERWLGKFGQVDKWNFCLSAARMPQIRSDYVETSTPEP